MVVEFPPPTTSYYHSRICFSPVGKLAVSGS